MDLVEIVANKNEVLENVLKEKALYWKEEAGLLFGIIEKKEVEELRGILNMRKVPKDVKGLHDILMKYGVRRVYVVFEVDDDKTAGRIIGKKGWRIKKLAEYVGHPIRAVIRDQRRV